MFLKIKIPLTHFVKVSGMTKHVSLSYMYARFISPGLITSFKTQFSRLYIALNECIGSKLRSLLLTIAASLRSLNIAYKRSIVLMSFPFRRVYLYSTYLFSVVYYNTNFSICHYTCGIIVFNRKGVLKLVITALLPNTSIKPNFSKSL